MKLFMLVFIAVEILFCSIGLAFCSSSEKEKNEIEQFVFGIFGKHSDSPSNIRSLHLRKDIFKNIDFTECVKRIQGNPPYQSFKSQEIDHHCRIKDTLTFELQYFGNGLSYFSINVTSNSYGIEKVKIVDQWKNDYIPILELCDDCKFKKIDSVHYEISGIIETTKARGDALFDYVFQPKLQFFAESQDSSKTSVTKEYSQTDEVNLSNNVEKKLHTIEIKNYDSNCDVTEKICSHLGKVKCDSIRKQLGGLPSSCYF